MKKILFFLPLLFLISCSNVEFSSDIEIAKAKILAVNIEPPVALPGQEITITVAADNGKAAAADTVITVGNKTFEDKNQVTIQLPDDISELFGKDISQELDKNGYTDIEVTAGIAKSLDKTVKLFRITKEIDSNTPYASNPKITLQYKSGNDFKEIKTGDEIELDLSKSTEFDLKFDKETEPESARKKYGFSWFVSSSSSEFPEMVEFDEKENRATFEFDKDSDAHWRFYLVLAPAKAEAGREKANYANAFIQFSVKKHE